MSHLYRGSFFFFYVPSCVRRVFPHRSYYMVQRGRVALLFGSLYSAFNPSLTEILLFVTYIAALGYEISCVVATVHRGSKTRRVKKGQNLYFRCFISVYF